MAEIVCAYACSHILFSRRPHPEGARRIVAGMRELGRRAAASKPDVLLCVTSEHMFNIDLSVQPPFCIGIADQYLPLGDMFIPRRPFPGHRDFAMSLVRHTAAHGFDLATAETITPDHGVTLPLLFINPWGSVPVVPLYVNINMEPLPAPARCRALAEVIRGFIERHRPAEERVAVFGSGGLSHWLNIPGAGKISAEFDEGMLELIAGGRAGEIAALSAADILEQGGNGGLEILNWLMMATTVPAARGETIFYEPMPAWQTGMGGVSMRIGSAGAPG